MKCVAYAKEKFDWDENLKHAHDYDWLCEAVTMVMHIKILLPFHEVFIGILWLFGSTRPAVWCMCECTKH